MREWLRRHPWLWLLLLAALLKLGFLLAPRQDLILDASAKKPKRADVEEVSRAGIAIALREGPLMPVIEYQWTDFFGGSLVTGVAAIPFFEVYGRNMFALKLVPLSFELLYVIAGYWLYRLLFGRRAAWIGGLLLAVSSPGQAVLSTIAWGTHPSLNAFVAVGLLLYVASLRAEANDDTKPGVLLRLRIAFGLLSGFAVYFGYGYLMVLAAVGVFELLREHPRSLLRRCGWMLVGFVVGLTPWWMYNLSHDFSGLVMEGRPLSEYVAVRDSLQRIAARIPELLFRWLPASQGQRSMFGVPGHWIGVLCAASLVALASAGSWRLRSSFRSGLRALVGRRDGGLDPGLLLVLHLTIVVVAICITDFFDVLDDSRLIRMRYLAPLFPALFGLAGAGADRCLDARPAARWFASALVVVYAFFGVAGSIQLIAPGEFGAFLGVSVDRRFAHGRWIGVRFADDPERLESIVAELERKRGPVQRDELLSGMSVGVRVVVHGHLGSGDLVKYERSLEVEARLAEELSAESGSYFLPPQMARDHRRRMLERMECDPCTLRDRLLERE